MNDGDDGDDDDDDDDDGVVDGRWNNNPLSIAIRSMRNRAGAQYRPVHAEGIHRRCRQNSGLKTCFGWIGRWRLNREK